ncbi:endonuclease/exonuclease/phosphatase family protein [Polaribacter cellanae]|uniref:Endonuclease/exonuclease/phosphatase family protein n=1 Tax=Polaribacter cellanae TaxID=2818493 RepID=A0A975H7W1_9FLAO|nr:endonuclease/exonuclease/phosphatase family protein [Polaribacter cellanae]QTE23473.1 endonuclease/exonuclease/phosphatase family protein [Polaribacter cellanae]
MKNLSFLDKIFYLLNSLLATLLLLSYLLPFISPSTIPFFAVLSLFVPVLIIINLVFFIYWLIKLKKQAFLSVFVLIIGWFFSSPFYKISSRNSYLNSDLKVMSYNVKAFDLFTNKKDSTSNTGYDFITDKNPDILAIQEYYQSTKIHLSYPYKFIKRKNDKGKFGMAIYSKYKIINSGSLDFKGTSNNIIYVDVVKKKDTIRIYNLHLESLRIKPNEENFGEENSEKLLKRVTNSFEKQAEQTKLFLTHEQKWQGKKIICGDFNNTAYSWVYNQIAEHKKDAFIIAGQGLGKTFNYWFPMRIDFILTDENAIINQFKSFSEEYSDHFPIQAKVNW